MNRAQNSAGRALMFRGQGTDVLRTGHGHSADRAQMFRKHSTSILRLAVWQFGEIHDGIPQNSSDKSKLLLACTIAILSIQ